MLVPSAATRPSLSVAEQFGHRLLMRDRPRAALSDPLPVFPEGGCRDGGLVWVSVGNGLGRVSSHGNKGSARYRRCPGTVPRGAPVLIVGRWLLPCTGQSPALDAVQTEFNVGQPWRSAGPGLVLHGDRLDRRSRCASGAAARSILVPKGQKADSGFRISLLTCVGTAGF